MSYIDEKIVCDAPAGRIEDATSYRHFIGPFLAILKRAELGPAFGDGETAVLMYDTETFPVASAPGAESLTVRDGKITRSRFVFDRKPFEGARPSRAEPDSPR
jgi:hypothetical protein